MKPQTVDDWRRAVDLAAAELASFDRRNANVTFTSKRHQRWVLVNVLEHARMGEAWAVARAGAGASVKTRGAARPTSRSRRKGRSRWDNVKFAENWTAACERSGPPYTYAHVAQEFEWLDGAKRVDADPDYLGRLWRKHGRPGPIPE